MWSDNYTPGCKYDTVDCTGCSCNPSPLDMYLNDKYEYKTLKEIRKEKIMKIYDNK